MFQFCDVSVVSSLFEPLAFLWVCWLIHELGIEVRPL